MTEVLQPLKSAKHRAFVVSKKLRTTLHRCSLRVNDWRWARAETKRPYVYNGFPHTFLSHPDPEPYSSPAPAPAILWICWAGGDMTPTRQRSLDMLREQKNLDIRLITGREDIELVGHPFHPAYDHLTPVHKSDYLRAYAMHHYGGIYTDIKPYTHQLYPVIDQINSSPDTWVVGYREITSEYAPEMPYELGRALKKHYRALIGPSAFAFKPHSPFTREWMAQLHRTLTFYQDQLEETASITDTYRLPAAYPIRWTEILCTIIHPLSLKHQSHILFDERIKPVLKNYR